MPVPETIAPQMEPLYWSKQKTNIRDAKILVVDDSALIRELIGACLMTDGYNNVCYAENGQDALEVISLEVPDLIILDLEMPVMDGFELCQKLRLRPDTKAIPILIQSGRDTASDITLAFEYGASDMVIKPIKKYEILARTKVHLEHYFFVQKLTDFHDRIASELEQARKLQLDLCPSKKELKNLETLYGIKIGWHYEPSSELGGDIGGMIPVNEHTLAFYIADFAGHGVAAALNTFRLQSWLYSQSKYFEYPSKLLEKLNNFLFHSLKKESYATMLYGCIDLKSNVLTYAAAGTQPPLLHTPENDHNFSLCNSNGMPLGLRENWTYSNRSLPFGIGTKLILYSDALVEVERRPGEFLGEEGLKEEVSNIWKEKPTPQDLINTIVTNFQSRLGTEAPDDLTIIYLENSGDKNG